MPYIGHSPTNAGSFIEVDDFGSSFNGSTTAFTLQVGSVSITPNIQNLLIMIDGVVQQPTSAFNVSGSTITFTEAPASGADLYAILMGQSASVGGGTIGADELKVSGDGSNGQVLTSDGDGTFSWATDAEDYVPLAGGTMTGTLAMGSNNITSTGTITGTLGTASQTAITSVGTLTALTLGGDLSVPQKIIHVGDTNTYLSFGDDSLDIVTGGTTGQTIDHGVFYNYTDLVIAEYIKHDGDTDNYIQFGTDTLTISKPTTFEGTIGLAGTAPNATMALTTEFETSNYIAKLQNTHTSDGHGLLIRAGTNSSQESLHVQKHDNTSLFKVTGDGTATFGGNVELNSDSTRFKVGASDDCQFFHNGTETYIQNTTGHLYLHNNVANKDIKIHQEGAGGGVKISTNNTIAVDIDNSHNATFYGHILPSANNTKALGQDGNMWDVLWTNEINASADGIVYMCNSGGTVQMDGRVNFKDIIWGESTYGFRFYRSDLGVENFRIADNSDVTGGHGSYHTSSDETLKKNISTISSGLDKVNAMRGVEFKWKKEHDPHPEGETNHQRVNLGFIAQELETVVPEVVNTNSVTGLKAVLDANQLTAVLVEAIKELSDKLDTANAKITALENA